MKTKPASPGPRYQALLQLMRAAENLWNASRVFFARWDLSASQFNVLNLLAEQPEGRSQSDLSRLLIMHRSNATGLIDRLEKRGLLSRRPAPGDRRAWRVVLTPAGEKLVRRILPEYYKLSEEVWDGVSAHGTKRLLNDVSQVGGNAAQIERKLHSAK